MRILAIETVDKTGSVAALADAGLLAEVALDPKHRSAQSLAPGIQKLLEQVGWRPADVELVAVATGPGSFTGLRIGVATAKTFAYAIGCQAIGVHTMEAIAARVPTEYQRFSTVVDAQRNELFVADFLRRPDGLLTGQETTRIVVAEQWIAALSAGAVVSGPGLAKWQSKLQAESPEVTIVAERLWHPSAAAIGDIGWRSVKSGETCDVMALAPQYFRRTAAEEQWERKQTSGTQTE